MDDFNVCKECKCNDKDKEINNLQNKLKEIKKAEMRNGILDVLKLFRSENNELWLKIYELSGLKTKEEITKIRSAREQNNEELINCLQLIFIQNKKEAIEIFKQIVDNDKKINCLLEGILC